MRLVYYYIRYRCIRKCWHV